MGIELFGDKSSLPPLYTPAIFLDALEGIGWRPGVVPETVIYTYAHFDAYLSTQGDRYTPNHMLGTGPGRFFIVNASDDRVGVNCLGTGPSATAAQIELQAGLGVRRVVIVGTAGGMTTRQSPGEIVLPTLAVRADGTSDHYAPADAPARPDDHLFTALAEHLAAQDIDALAAPCWTTAAPFRTTVDEIAYYASHGVRAVEEEAAALFVVGAACGIETAAALVIDGVPTDDGGWRLDLPTAQQQLQRLFASVLEFATAL